MIDNRQCPVCCCGETVVFVDRADVPVHQNLLFATPEAARAVNRGRLLMRCCTRCSFVFNAAFDESLLSYGQAYENTQIHSPAFEQYVDSLVDRILACGPPGMRIVEVGCGKGHFLRKLLQHDPKATGVGFDPAYVGELEGMNGRLRFERRFYDGRAADVPADVVICRHVIEHVARPLELLRSVRAAVASAPDARVYFETPDVRWILRHGVVWDLFYEHCSLFTPASLNAAFEAAGFSVRSMRTVFGEQYQWLEAVIADEPVMPRFDAADIPSLAETFGRTEKQRVARWREQLRTWAAGGPVVLWGAGAKGVTFANLADPDTRLLAAVVDVNRAKQGKYLAGSAHPIVAPADLQQLEAKFALVLNPNYRHEIEREITEQGLRCSVIDLMQATEP